MNLIERDDPLYFTETSSESYDKHQYKVVKKNKTNIVVDSWKEAENIWWNNRSFLSHIEVLDRKETGGFLDGK